MSLARREVDDEREEEGARAPAATAHELLLVSGQW